MNDVLTSPKSQRERLEGFFLFIVLMLALVPWLVVQMNIALNTNHAWLMVAASRILEGGSMLADVYETNPPLSILLYFPPVLMSRYLAIPLEYAPYIFGLIGLALSSGAVWYLLRLFPNFDVYGRRVFFSAYVLAGAILPSNVYFAERDEFVLWGLFPFLMAQLLITAGIKIPGSKAWPILLLSAVCILIKPHYIIFPGLLFLHRLVVKRSLLAVIKSPDFIAASLATIGCAAVVAIFFMDYAIQIFPEVLKYYLTLSHPDFLMLWKQYMVAAIVLSILIIALNIPKQDKVIVALSIAATILSIGLFVIQGKGFYYHLIPARVFMFCGWAWLFYVCLIAVINNKFYACLACILTFAVSAYVLIPLKTNYITHEQYRDVGLSKLAKSCGSDCSFFVFTQNMEMIWQASMYSGVPHASRFPGLWWLHSMLRDGVDVADRDKYARYIAEDLRRYKPDILAIASGLIMDDGKEFDFMQFFGAEDEFSSEVANYKKTRVMKDNRGDYFKGSSLDYDFFINYDVYERQD